MSFEDFSDNSEQEPIDPFILEIYTGEHVLATVNKLMDKRPDHLKSSMEVHLQNAELNHETWKKMLQELIPEERAAFECALAEGLEDFYFTHYMALRRRLSGDGEEK